VRSFAVSPLASRRFAFFTSRRSRAIAAFPAFGYLQLPAMSALSAMTAFLANPAIPANFLNQLESSSRLRIVLIVTPMVSKPSSDCGLAESRIAPRAWVFVGWRDLHQIRKDTG
jgi:hypothetical protein